MAWRGWTGSQLGRRTTFSMASLRFHLFLSYLFLASIYGCSDFGSRACQRWLYSLGLSIYSTSGAAQSSYLFCFRSRRRYRIAKRSVDQITDRSDDTANECYQSFDRATRKQAQWESNWLVQRGAIFSSHWTNWTAEFERIQQYGRRRIGGNQHLQQPERFRKHFYQRQCYHRTGRSQK